MAAQKDPTTMTVDELRDEAKRRGITGTSHMKKAELIENVRGESRAGNGERGHGAGEPVGDDKAVRYAQHITSADEHEERSGRSLVTRDHEAIRRWAEARNATPASIRGSRHGDHLGVLRFDFPGYDEGGNLVAVSWDEWFRTFDERNLNFVYQEHRVDGTMSNFFRLDNPQREDG